MQSKERARLAVSRRQFLRMGLISSCGLALAACRSRILSRPPATPLPNPTPTLRPAPQAIVGDVLDYALTSDQWPGDFGFVTFRIHEALHEGQSVYYIRTDASNENYARELLELHTLGVTGNPNLEKVFPAFKSQRVGLASNLI